MRTIRTLGVAWVAVLGVVALTASNASAYAPLWHVHLFRCANVLSGEYKTLSECEHRSGSAGANGWSVLAGTLELYNLVRGKTIKTVSRNVSGNVAKLKGVGTTINCKKVSDTGNIKGGMPGTDETTVTFTECSVEGKTEAECHVNGQGETGNKVVVSAKTELVYIGTKAQAEKEEPPVGDLFKPASGTTFVTLDLEGTNCQTTGLVKVTGSVVANMSPGANEPAQLVGTLKFPTEPLKKAYQWENEVEGVENGKGKLNELKPELHAFGSSPNTQSGEEEVEAEPEALEIEGQKIDNTYWLSVSSL